MKVQHLSLVDKPQHLQPDDIRVTTLCGLSKKLNLKPNRPMCRECTDKYMKEVDFVLQKFSVMTKLLEDVTDALARADDSGALVHETQEAYRKQNGIYVNRTSNGYLR